MARRARNTPAFVARESELRRLTELLSSECLGAVVFGAPGIGKSRLVAECAARVAALGTEVLTIAATRSSRDVPLGAVVGVLPPEPGTNTASADPGARLDALTQAFEQLHARVGERFMLVVDDAHLLDDLSATLVHQVARGGGAFVVITLTEGEQLPDAIDALWRAGLVEQLDLPPFDFVEVGAYCRSALDGLVDAPTRRRLAHASAGNPLYLRELLAAGTESGALAERGGIWSWHGPLTAGPRLVQMVELQFAGVGPELRALLDLLAIGDTVDLDLLVELAGADALERAEKARFVAVDLEGACATVRLAHPLHALALRENMTAMALRRISGALADALSSRATPREGDALKLAVLEVSANREHDADGLMEATALASALGDLELCEWLARAARDAGAGEAAAIALDECLIWQGRFSEVDLGEPSSSTVEPELVARRARARAAAAFLGPGDDALASDVLVRAERQLDGHYLAADVRSHRAEIAMFSCHLEVAFRLARDVLADETAKSVARATAYGALLPSMALTGLVDDAPAIAEEAFAFVFAQPNPPLWEGAGIVVGQFIAALLGGRLAELDPVLDELYTDAAARPLDPMRGLWAMMLGRSAIARGDLVRSVELLTEAAALLRTNDPGRILAWCLGALAQAAGQCGDVERARTAAAELTRERHPAMRAVDVDLELGLAWALAADGRVDAGRKIALAAAATAVECQAHGVAALALHEAVRLGARGEEVSRVDRGAVQGELLRATALVPDALDRRDVEQLLAVAARLGDCDAHLWAAEIAAVAGVHADEAGDQRQGARALLLRSRELAACVDAHTPMLIWASQRSSQAGLTRRELEISRLAVRGLGNTDIADQLFVSRRTVENHLASVYRKLGVSSRAELVDLVTPPRPT